MSALTFKEIVEDNIKKLIKDKEPCCFALRTWAIVIAMTFGGKIEDIEKIAKGMDAYKSWIGNVNINRYFS